MLCMYTHHPLQRKSENAEETSSQDAGTVGLSDVQGSSSASVGIGGTRRCGGRGLGGGAGARGGRGSSGHGSWRRARAARGGVRSRSVLSTTFDGLASLLRSSLIRVGGNAKLFPLLADVRWHHGGVVGDVGLHAAVGAGAGPVEGVL